MGSQFVDGSPDWGGLGSSMVKLFQNAPGGALDNIAKAEAIKAAREKRARETELWELGKTEAAKLDPATPQAQAAPITTYGPYVGDPATDPGVTKGLPTATFIDPREQTAAEARRAFLVGTGALATRQDPKYAPQALGYASVGAAGVPDDPRKRAELEYYAKGSFPTHIGVDESKQPYKQWVPVNEKGEAIGAPVASRTKPGESYALSGTVSPTLPNPIESIPIAQNNFNELAAQLKAKVASGLPISDAEINRARDTFNAGWPREVEYREDKLTGKILPLTKPKTMPAAGGPAAWLAQVLTDIDTPVPTTAAVPTGAVGADGKPVVAPDPAAAAATPPPPAVTLPAPAAAAAAAPQSLVQALPPVGTGDPRPVIEYYTKHPIVEAMDKAQSGYSSMVANMPFDNAASDLALFIGAAKVLDPPSVVREQEGKNVSRTASPMDQFYGMLNRAQGGSGLTREARAQIWNMVNEKLRLDIGNAKPLFEQASVQLTQRGANPKDFLPPLAQVQEVDRAKINSIMINAKDPARPLQVPSTIDPYGGGGTAARRLGGRSSAVTPPPAPAAAPPAPATGGGGGRSVDDILEGR